MVLVEGLFDVFNDWSRFVNLHFTMLKAWDETTRAALDEARIKLSLVIESHGGGGRDLAVVNGALLPMVIHSFSLKSDPSSLTERAEVSAVKDGLRRHCGRPLSDSSLSR